MQTNIPILTYHQIEEAPPRGAAMRSLYVSPGAFARQMGMLSRLGFTGLSMGELLPYLGGQKSGRVVGITFDDGYLNNLTYALPVLQSFGFSATCYVVSDCIGGTNVWDQSTGVLSAALMNTKALARWVEGGQEVGSHTLSHCRLSEQSDEAALREIVKSKQDLERLLGVAVHQFCYPYGDFDERSVRFVSQAGYLSATTTKRSRVRVDKGAFTQNGAGTAHFQLPRVPVVRSTSWVQFLLKIATSYEDRLAN